MRAKLFIGGMLAVATAMAAATAQAENVLRWSSQGDALTLDPHSQNEGPTTVTNQQMYDALVQRDWELKLHPALATEWKPLDSNTWEFKLRQGVKFHDGSDFTADDVVFSLKRAKAKTSDFKGYVNSITDVVKVDDFTVHVRTQAANPILPSQLNSVRIMSKAWSVANTVVEPQDYADNEETFAVRNTNGTGPFVLELREPDVQTVMVKNENYWDLTDYPHNVDKIIYRPVQSNPTRVAALLSGELDFLLDPPVQDLGRIKATPGLTLKQVAQIRTIFLGMDQASDELKYADVKGANPFSDKRVRQAMYQAIDIETIKKKVMRGLSFPAGIVTSPGVHGYTEALDKRLPYDVDRAKALMAEAGYEDGFGVTLDCPNNRYVNDEAICQAVVPMLAQIGIKVDLAARPKSVHFKRLQQRDTSFYMLGWGVPTLDSHYVFEYLAHTTDGKRGSWNFTGFSNSRMDEVTEKMLSEVDQEKRDQLVAEAWDILKGDIAYLPLHHQVISWAMSDKLDLPIVANDSPNFKWARFK